MNLTVLYLYQSIVQVWGSEYGQNNDIPYMLYGNGDMFRDMVNAHGEGKESGDGWTRQIEDECQYV